MPGTPGYRLCLAGPSPSMPGNLNPLAARTFTNGPHSRERDAEASCGPSIRCCRGSSESGNVSALPLSYGLPKVPGWTRTNDLSLHREVTQLFAIGNFNVGDQVDQVTAFRQSVALPLGQPNHVRYGIRTRTLREVTQSFATDNSVAAGLEATETSARPGVSHYGTTRCKTRRSIILHINSALVLRRVPETDHLTLPHL